MGTPMAFESQVENSASAGQFEKAQPRSYTKGGRRIQDL